MIEEQEAGLPTVEVWRKHGLNTAGLRFLTPVACARSKTRTVSSSGCWPTACSTTLSRRICREKSDAASLAPSGVTRRSA